MIANPIPQEHELRKRILTLIHQTAAEGVERIFNAKTLPFPTARVVELSEERAYKLIYNSSTTMPNRAQIAAQYRAYLKTSGLFLKLTY